MTTSPNAKQRGSLLVVGSALKAGGQLTVEARSAITNADKVFYGDSNPVTIGQIRSLNDNAQTLTDLYGKDKPRPQTYAEMVKRIMSAVREGLDVCAVFYGHPGVFAQVPHQVIHTARSEGYPAMMLAGVSAEDCLFADLLIDPGRYGCLSYEATDFLIHRRVFDRRSVLVLWQIGIIGQLDYQGKRYDRDTGGVPMLVEILREQYPADHPAIIYEAAQVAIFSSRMETVPIGELPGADLTTTSTLVLTPAPEWNQKTADMDRVKALGLDGYVKERRARREAALEN